MEIALQVEFIADLYENHIKLLFYSILESNIINF
jgi:hypothetical protein